MDHMNDIVKLAVDAYHGKVEKYSVSESQDLLRQALIEANGGSTKLNYKNLRDGKANGLFRLVEEILSRTVVEGLQNDDFFMAMVDFRNLALGDENLFIVDDNNLFVVADTAEGTQAVRRQRLGDQTETSIPTTMKTVRIYEELNRVLAGRIDFNAMIDKVAESFRQKLANDVYALWSNASAADLGGVAFFPSAGSFDEDELLDVISHVEAAAGGKQATIVCTKKAARQLLPGIVMGREAESDMYNLGYVGKFYGTPVVVTPQRHKIGTTEFVMDDNMLTIIAGDDKPIKVVYEGDPLVFVREPKDNMDLTHEYFYGERYGMGIVLAGGNAGVGRYNLA